MTKPEANAMAKFTAGLFRDATPEQIGYLAEQYEHFPKLIAEATVKTHRMNHEFLSIPNLLIGMKSAMERAAAKHTESRTERTIDWLRRTLPATTAGKPDDACLLEHFANAWNDVYAMSHVDDKAKDQVRQAIHGHAFAAFCQIGMDSQTAMQWADEAVPTMQAMKPQEVAA